MSTFMANKGNIVRTWYVLDAANKPLGKTAAAAATLLRGKHKPEFTPGRAWLSGPQAAVRRRGPAQTRRQALAPQKAKKI